jgi:hypothetical protein
VEEEEGVVLSATFEPGWCSGSIVVSSFLHW